MGEADVARAESVEPGAAYVRANRFAAELAADPVAATYVDRFVEIVVESLAAE